MKHSFHLDNETLRFPDGSTLPLYSEEAFALLSELWLKVGWNAHYHYGFTWMGQPVLQLPEDLITLQEVIVERAPDVIIETGIAMGGSLLFYATICQARGAGRVIGIDKALRPHNRKALEEHPLAPYITLVDGSSSDPETLEQVHLDSEERVMVILDSNHSAEHVSKELELFAPLVSHNQYLVVADGFKKMLSDAPRGKSAWEKDNPITAVEKFLADHPEFTLESPHKAYNRCSYRDRVTHLQSGWLKRATHP